MTNGNRLRTMSNEELSKQLVIDIDGLEKYRLYFSAPTGKMFLSRKKAEKVTLEWLNQQEDEIIE